MALEAAVKRAVRRLVRAFRDYAASKGWGPEDYRLYVRPNFDWLKCNFILEAKQFPHADLFENWDEIMDFLEKNLKDDPDLFHMIGLSINTFAQGEEGGLYSIPPSYEEAEEFER